jgi:bifunctional non-homologous end joining protein LigD
MHRNKTVYYYAFDLLYLNKFDIRSLSLVERKRLLKRVLAVAPSLLRYHGHYKDDAYTALAERVKNQDLEGVIAKLAKAPYDPELNGNWVKLLNPNYSQAPGRRKWFSDKK